MDETVTAMAITYITDLFRGRSDGHEAEHSLRVYRNALRIAEEEPGCDRDIVALAALLHDADDPKLFPTENHANARAFLNSMQICPETAERICAVIDSVSFSRNRERHPDTPEGKVVQDADRLDAMGAIGIARTYAFGGQHGRSIRESTQHFFDKLLLLRDEMNTESAKRMAESRHSFLKLFLEELEFETESFRPPQAL